MQSKTEHPPFLRAAEQGADAEQSTPADRRSEEGRAESADGRAAATSGRAETGGARGRDELLVHEDGAPDGRTGGDGLPWPRSGPHGADPARGGPDLARGAGDDGGS